MTITLFAHELQRIVTSGLAFASRDDTLPAICAVHFSTEDGHLIVRATDRYVAARLRLPNTTTNGELQPVVISRDDLRTVLSVFKAGRYSSNRVSIEAADGKVRFATDGTLDTEPAMTVEVNAVDGKFPNIDEHIDKARNAPPTADHIGLTSRVLACATKLPVSDRAALTIRVTGPRKPVYITAEGHEALLMPVQLAAHVEATEAAA